MPSDRTFGHLDLRHPTSVTDSGEVDKPLFETDTQFLALSGKSSQDCSLITGQQRQERSLKGQEISKHTSHEATFPMDVGTSSFFQWTWLYDENKFN